MLIYIAANMLDDISSYFMKFLTLFSDVKLFLTLLFAPLLVQSGKVVVVVTVNEMQNMLEYV